MVDFAFINYFIYFGAC